MKVQLQFNNDQLIAVNSLLQKLYTVRSDQYNGTQRVFISIGLELADKFDKKCKSQVKKASLFNQKTKIKLTLKYYEAWSLNQICIELFSWSENEFQKHQIQSVINKLDKWVQ